jgi:hypothetical protein
MWAAMIACITSNEEDRKVFAQLIAQYNTVNKDGVTYRLNGKTITERPFDFKNTIIRELKTHQYSLSLPGYGIIWMTLMSSGKKEWVVHKNVYLCI